MPICHACRGNVEADDKFCPHCGATLLANSQSFIRCLEDGKHIRIIVSVRIRKVIVKVVPIRDTYGLNIGIVKINSRIDSQMRGSRP